MEQNEEYEEQVDVSRPTVLMRAAVSIKDLMCRDEVVTFTILEYYLLTMSRKLQRLLERQFGEEKLDKEIVKSELDAIGEDLRNSVGAELLDWQIEPEAVTVIVDQLVSSMYNSFREMRVRHRASNFIHQSLGSLLGDLIQ